MAEQYGILTVEAIRGGTITEIRAYLEVVEDAYNNLYALDIIIDRAREISNDAGNASGYGKRKKPNFRSLKPLKGVDNLILPEDKLLLSSIVIQSPGIWEFLGSLNPLEVMRNYLNDRHERKKDVNYRESLERERLILENERLRTQTIQDYANLLRDLNVPEEQIRPVLAEHGFNALSRLNSFQDGNLIGGASIRRAKAPTDPRRR